MTVTRFLMLALVAVLGLVLSACSTLDLADYCRYSEDPSLRQADPESLALVIGVRPERTRRTPFVVLRNLSEDNGKTFVRLSASPAPHPLPAGLDESRCAGVDWSSYDLTVDPEEWRAFWQDDRASRFEIGIAFLEGHEPLSLSAFGAAIMDTRSADHVVSCGCYWR